MSKYNAKHCEYDGYNFDSESEMRRYKYLKELEKCSEVHGLEVHPKFLLQDKLVWCGEKIAKIEYEADFSYWNGDMIIVEDVKGMPTEGAKLKRKLFIDKWCVNNADGLCRSLEWIVEAPKYTGLEWMDYFDLVKLRKQRKKVKT